MLQNAIQIKNITKIYQKSPHNLALDNITLSIKRGSVFGLLGPNGAGKSTLINILGGLVLKTKGFVSIWGNDIEKSPEQARMQIGVVPQELSVDAFFTPLETLIFQAGLYGMTITKKQSLETLDMVGLSEKAHSYSRTLSGGMKRRLMIAKALVHNPPIVILDEPTAGVDIALRQQLWENIRILNKAGTTVLLTTHYLEEAEKLCDQIAIINKGQLITNQPTQELLKTIDSKEIIITFQKDIIRIPDELRKLNIQQLSPRILKIFYQTAHFNFDNIIDLIKILNIPIQDLQTIEPDLEDVFLQLTK